MNEAKSMSFPQKAVKIFTSPVQVMKDIKDNPKVLTPLIFLSILAIFIFLLSAPITQIALSKMNSLMLEKYGISMPQTSTNSAVGVIFAPVGLILGLLVGSFFLWLFSKIFGGAAKFKQIFSVNSHAMIITYIFTLISVPICVMLNTDVNPFSLAILMPNGAIDSFVYDIMYSITVFGVWQALVVAVGLYVVNDFSKTKGYLISISVYVLSIVITASSMMTPFWVQNMMHK